MKSKALGKKIMILMLLLIIIALSFTLISTETELRNIQEEKKIQNEIQNDLINKNDTLTEEICALKTIIDNNAEVENSDFTIDEQTEKSQEIEDGYIALLNLQKYKREKLYQLMGNDRTFMDSRFELYYYFDPSFVSVGDNIGGFVVSEFMSDDEDFFMQFSILFDGKAFVQGDFVYLAGDYDDHIFFELDDSYQTKLPFIDVDQEVKYIFVKNYKDYLSQSEIESLIENSSIKKNIEISNLVIGGQLGSEIYYACEMSSVAGN